MAQMQSPNMSTVNGPATGGVGPLISIGVKAKSPTDNISAPSSTLPASQVAPPSTPAPSSANTANTSTNSSTSVPNSGNGSTLYAPGYTPQNTPPNQPGGTPPPPAAPVSGGYTTPNGATTNINGAITSPAPNGGLYSSLVGQLANTSQNYGGLAQTAAGNIAGIQTNIGQLRQQAGQAEGAYNTGGLTLPVAQGRAQAVAQTEATQEAGLGIQQQAQQGLFQNLISAQTAQQQGLTSAAGLAQPSTAAYGQTVFNPLTGQYENGGGLPPDVLQQYANMAANGQYSAIPAAITSNPVLSAQLNQAAQQINPNYNPITSAAQGSAASTNVQNAGTAATSAAASGLQTSTQNYVTANTAYTAAQNQSNNLRQILQTTGINSNPQFVNTPLNNLQNQLGSAQYTSFITALTEMQQKYTNLLSTVGSQTPTVNGQQATAILNPASTPAQINAAIDALDNAAYAGLKPLYDQIGTYSGQLNGTGNTNAQSNSTSEYDF